MTQREVEALVARISSGSITMQDRDLMITTFKPILVTWSRTLDFVNSWHVIAPRPTIRGSNRPRV